MEQVTWLRTAALDELPIGIVRLSTDERITYVNKAAREASDMLQVGTHIHELRVDAESRERLKAQIAERFSKEAGASYDISLMGQTNTISDVLNITAVPEYGKDGQLLGSLAFMRSRKLELAVLGMHEIIAGADDWRPLLEGVAAQLHRYIEFDSMLVTTVSENRKHLRILLQTDQVPVATASPVTPYKWWPMPEWAKAMLNELSLEAVDVHDMFSRSPYKELAAGDPVTQAWLAQGYRHLLRYPVMQSGVLIAIVSLEKRADVPFAAADLNIARHLPIQEAVKIALALDKKAEADFAIDMLRDLGSIAGDTDALQTQLVTRLAQHYGWEHVALFGVDRDKKVFRLAKQHCIGMRSLKNNYEQPFDEGVLGEVLRIGRAVVIDDTRQRARPVTYREGLKDSLSDMCLPVPGDRLRWILNIESTQKDAFADEEQQSVELLLSMVGFILDRAASRDLNSAIFDSVADAVVLTSRDGVIQQLNPAAQQMFGLRVGDLRERNLARYLAPGAAGSGLPVPAEGFGETVVASKTLASTPVTVRGEDGRETPAIASGATLPMELGGKVFVLSDLTYATRLQQLESLKTIFGSVAGETRVPLALASTFVSDIVKATRGNHAGGPCLGDVADLASKALAQLRKADLPLERLVRLSTRPPEQQVMISVLNVQETVNQLLAELPRHEANAVGVSQAPIDPLVKTGLSEFGFCFQSIVAFLLRRKSQNEQLQVKIESHPDHAVVSIELKEEHERTLESARIIAESARDLKQFSFPQEFITELMNRMGCDYQPPRQGDPRFVMTLPSA